jgi:hypothetical protein
MASLRFLTTVLLTVTLGSCGSSDTPAGSSEGGVVADGPPAGPSPDGGVVDMAAASTPDVAAGVDTTPAMSAAMVSLKIDGRVLDTGNNLWQGHHRRKTNFDMTLGQSVGTFPREASMLVELSLDPMKGEANVLGVDAVQFVSVLMRVNMADAGADAGIYDARFMPGMAGAPMFEFTTDGKLLTMKFKGPMKQNGGAERQVEGTVIMSPYTKYF